MPVRQECATKVAVGAPLRRTRCQTLANTGDFGIHMGALTVAAAVALPWQCRRRTTHPGRIITIGPVREGGRAGQAAGTSADGDCGEAA